VAAQRVAVIGGGPGGLFAARLLARDHADWQITVHERLPPSDTFGFGVGLTRGLLRNLARADRAVHDDLVAAERDFSSALFRLPAGDVELPASHAGGISRARLLALLLERAREAGVTIEMGEAPSLGALSEQADLVIAADGVSSLTRAQLVSELGATEDLGRGFFIWCAAPLALDGTIFLPVRTADGTFVAHAYPYAEGLSTFVIETDAATLERAGCRSEHFESDGDSDEASLRYLSEAFAELCGGRQLIGNRSRWMNFRTVRCARWYAGNVVVLGDAAATAHPSIGSGTKLAMEAAIALTQSMRSLDGEAPAARLGDFDAGLRPSVERLQDRARRSQLWWESFPKRLDLQPARIALAYMSRAGAVSLDRFAEAAPVLARQAAADFAGVDIQEVPAAGLADWVAQRRFRANGIELPGRILEASSDPGLTDVVVDFDDPWGAAAATRLAEVRAFAAGGHEAVRLTGGDSRGALLDRLALGERIRSELGVAVAVSSPREHLGDAIDGLVAGRTDLIALRN